MTVMGPGSSGGSAESPRPRAPRHARRGGDNISRAGEEVGRERWGGKGREFIHPHGWSRGGTLACARCPPRLGHAGEGAPKVTE